jgi:hypothetical protein
LIDPLYRIYYQSFVYSVVNMAHHLLVSRQFGDPTKPPPSPEYLAENIAPRLLAVEGTLFALSMSAILMRFYVRVFMLKMFGWDGK